MMTTHHALSPNPPPVSRLVLCDRLLTMAQDIDRLGLRHAAEHLVGLADAVLIAPPPRRRQASAPRHPAQ